MKSWKQKLTGGQVEQTELQKLEQEISNAYAYAGNLQYNIKCLEQQLHAQNMVIGDLVKKRIELTKPKLEAAPAPEAKEEGDAVNG